MLVSLTFALSLLFSAVSQDFQGDVVCIPPLLIGIDSTNTQCSCPSHNTSTNCYTLSDRMEHNMSLFNNNTEVILMAGLHYINITNNEHFSDNVHSLVFSGDQEETTTILCVKEFSFIFNNSAYVNISH